MNVIVSGKNLKSQRRFDSIRWTKSKRSSAISTISSRPTSRCRPTGEERRTDLPRRRHRVGHGTILKSMDTREEMYAAINGAIGKIERQLKKYKQKLRESPRRRRATPTEEIPASLDSTTRS